MGKKNVKPKDRPSTWEKVRDEETRGNMAGIEYAVYLAGFVLKDSYGYSAKQFYPFIWGIQKNLNLYNRADKPVTFKDCVDNMIRDIPAYEAMMKRFGMKVEPGPYFHRHGPLDRPANGRDELIAYNAAKAYAIRVLRCFIFKVLREDDSWSLDGISEFFEMVDHWDEMHRTGYVTEKEFRQACDEEYQFQFKAFPKNIPADDVWAVGEDATAWHKYCREQIRNGNV